MLVWLQSWRDRAEIVRIWQYLLGQQSNGHGAGL